MAGDGRIFVAIAAYKEPELRLTINSCIDQASNPERLTFGICLQHDNSGVAEVREDCLDGLDADLRLDAVDWTASKGGCWARHRVQGLYAGEQYTMQIDAHSRMAPGWDADLVEMMHTFPAPKPLITGFPPLYRREGGVDVIPEDRDTVAVTVVDDWSPEGWIWHPVKEVPTETATPRHTRFLSGAFVFTLGAWNLEVRQDPEHLYTGEEFALTVRSFTAGYDLYNPTRVMLWHRMHEQPPAKYIHDGDDAVQFRHDRAQKRLRALLRGDPDRMLQPYSVGSARTVREFAAWSGLDVASFEASEDAVQGLAPPPTRAEV